jgi:NAD(P)-dependent dehydrogenase (short-subunit alcohol dehydrogenase family)
MILNKFKLTNKIAIASTAVEKMGGFDVLVNNADIIRRAPLLEFAEKDLDK